MAAAHETNPPDCGAVWDQNKARYQKVYKGVDEETLFNFSSKCLDFIFCGFFKKTTAIFADLNFLMSYKSCQIFS